MNSGKMLAVADSCFLIDWAKYKKRDIIRDIFKSVFITIDVMKEITSEETLSMISDYLADGFFVPITLSDTEREKVHELMISYARDNQAPAIHEPEASAVVFALNHGIEIVLSENTALKYHHQIRKNPDVWGASDVLKKALIDDLITTSNIKKEFETYSQETKHLFRKKDIEKEIKEIENIKKVK